MSPLLGFSDSSFSDYEDFKKACISLLRALKPYQSPGGARIKLPLATGTHFDDIAAQLEGFARPLWAIGALIHGDCLTEEETTELVVPYIRGLANGTDPNHPEYWGPVVLRDQRMVEMEIISFALLAAPDAMYHRQSAEAQKNISGWLGTINGKDFPVTNWLWFRVMTNLALVKVCGVPHEQLKTSMESDLDQMEQFYLYEGWAADGIWSKDGRQADYYSGSFAIQFSQLLYMKMAEDLDPVRCARFRERAIKFAQSFWRYFDSNGAAIPFGRSLTYRFAFAGFWSVAAFSGLQLASLIHKPPIPGYGSEKNEFNLRDEGVNWDVADWGSVKGLLLRHFRWWSDKHDMFNVDGTLTIGYTFPNMYMSEDYNSPQSPYWAMKSFVALGLPKAHPFWTAEEKPLPPRLPQNRLQGEIDIPCIEKVNPPVHILCNNGNHHFLLSAGQFCPWPLKATEAKYCKFSYSSHFGFSVPTSHSVLAQIAPDSTLALSKDNGETWRVPWKLQDYKFQDTILYCVNGEQEVLPSLCGTWRPWRDADVEVQTTLIAPSKRWPDWHIRVHKIKNKSTNGPEILACEGGFAIQGRGSEAGEALPSFGNDEALVTTKQDTPYLEGTCQMEYSALVCSDAGASGIKSLMDKDNQESGIERIQAEVLKPDANTNLIWQRTLIPTINFSIKSLDREGETVFVSAVFAVSRRNGAEIEYDKLDIGSRWADVPIIRNKGTLLSHIEKDGNAQDYISLY
jgi:hypothetical protein